MKMHPAFILLLSFLAAIFMGTLVLTLPIATVSQDISWLDALFTATSAVCVTGLVVVDTGTYFSPFGQTVILVLIQVGGLGVMTISVALFRWLGKSVSYRHRLLVQDLFAHTPREDIFHLIKNVVLFTFWVELLGAALLTIHWAHEVPIAQAVYRGIFHSVSAFCNAGFSLFPDSMMRYRDSLLLNLTICLLIIVGGIGFPVLYDIKLWIKNRAKKRSRLLVQTKMVLFTTLILVILGAVAFGLLESSTQNDIDLFGKITTSLFQSITCRTAGFNTVDIASLKDATLAVIIFLMFFGASPGSCGGGVKTTTLALLVAFTASRIKRNSRTNIFKKSIPHETVARSISLTMMALGIIGIVFFMLLAEGSRGGLNGLGSHDYFLAYLFETVSAFGTVGLSMGITAELSSWGKFWIITMMIIGRVGILAFTYIIIGSGTKRSIEYSEENIMIG